MTKRATTSSVATSAVTGLPISRKTPLHQLTPFARLVYAYTKRIPKGSTQPHTRAVTKTHQLASLSSPSLSLCHCLFVRAGRVSTYKLIAASIGHPKAFRAVGTALSLNPFAPHVPCHRVIASNGALGGFNGRKGQLDGEVLRKAAMLRAEGVVVDGGSGGGRVVGVGSVVSVSVAGGVELAEMEDGRLAAPMQ